MSQFNAKKCGFSSFKAEQPKDITHRFYRGPHVRLAQKATHTWNRWRVYEDLTKPEARHKNASSLASVPARPRRDRARTNDLVPKASEREMPVSANTPFSVRIVWVRRAGKELPKSLSLLNRLSDEGMVIWVIEVSNLVNVVIEDVIDFDLILFECFDPVESEMKTVVTQIRLGSRAPLMMLTNDQSVAWSVEALNAGADAIFTVSTPDEVILARCNALLRRWLASA